MNQLENFVTLLLQQLPFDLSTTLILILTGYLFFVLFALLFFIIFLWKRHKQKPSSSQTAVSALLCLLVSIFTVYYTSKYLITTEITPYLIGEATMEEAKKYDVINLSLHNELLKMNDDVISTVNKCNSPLLYGDKYIMPRHLDLLHCLGVE